MDIIILIFMILLFLETTFLVITTSKKSFIGSSSRRKVYVDTSTLMDPRFLPVANTGFIGDELIIPRSVTHELQLLADSKETEKRTRARAALETIREMERIVYFNTTILEDPLDRTPVDNRLINLAKANHGLILTNDFNLQKVAETEHIDVLNLNALALALQGEFLPGERTEVRIVSTGSNPRQGVGYLKDGSMVVVDNANNQVGKEIEIEFTRISQTASGTLLFARPVRRRSVRQKHSAEQRAAE